MATPQKRPDDSIPLYDGSYYLIVTKAMQAIRAQPGMTQKLGTATRELRSLAGHTKKRFSALSLVKKLVVMVLLIGAGAALAGGVYAWRSGGAAEALRADIVQLLEAGDVIGANQRLTALRALSGGVLEAGDQQKLERPLRSRTEALRKKKKAEVTGHKKAGRHDEALVALHELEALEVDPGYILYTRGEVLRAAGRDQDANEAYAEYTRLYPDSELTDDALFWQALAHKKAGAPDKARALLEQLVSHFPKSDYLTSAKRGLKDLPE